MAEDDDPVVASYDVYLTKSSATGHIGSHLPEEISPAKVFLLQYPAHRPSSKPYSAAGFQKPTSLRVKPDTGLLELDIPILTTEHYNLDAGSRFGKAIAESRTLQTGGTHGLGGGFSTAPAQPASIRDIRQHDDLATEPAELAIQTLGGKIARSSEKDPIYLLGSLRHNALHLSHLDAVVQMRPQLHHIDAEEEVSQKRFQANSNTIGAKLAPGFAPGPAKLESKAIEIKIKDNKDEAKDRNLNENARLLREIQADQWRPHSWVDKTDPASREVYNQSLHLSSEPGIGCLRSAISNGDWLDRMSAPREDGKKGLLAKLRGRERERARRKKAEEEKRQRTKGTSVVPTSNRGPLLTMSSESELSSASDTDHAGHEIELRKEDGPDIEMPDTSSIGDVEVKEELLVVPDVLPATPSLSRKRGGARKTRSKETVDVED